MAAPTSAFSFNDKGDDLRTIGQQLNVTTVLDGSVRRAGDRGRVTVQLSDVADGFQLWSERYDRELKDIFDVQDDIAKAIGERLRVTLAGDKDERLVEMAYSGAGRGSETKSQALAAARRSLELNPTSAPGHIALAAATLLYENNRAMAKQEFERALELRPNYGMGRCWYSLFFFEWTRAELDRRRRVCVAAPHGLHPPVN